MNIKYFDKSKGIISEISENGITVPFYGDKGPSLYYIKNGESILIELNKKDDKCIKDVCGIEFSMKHTVNDNMLSAEVIIKNNTDKEFIPDAIGLKLGIDSYMTEYPYWNDKFFPAYLRCEKTHFVGYFMSPLGKVVAVTCDSPVAAWELEYNTFEDEENCHFGHRIFTGNLLLTVNGKLPKRHPENLNGIKAREEKNWTINIMPLDSIKDYKRIVSEKFNIPMLEFDKYTVAMGEKVRLKVFTNEKYIVSVESPSGNITEKEIITPDEYGVYTVTVTTKSGKICEGKVYCRHDFGWYLKAARKNAVYKPQKASTHTESWYGHFSAFLAKKHYPDEVLDTLAKANFDEIMPYMYDFEKGEAIVIPWRVQNVALLVSLLVDLYETDTKNNKKYLDYANNMAKELLRRQTEDGAYRKNKTHYTSVIYIAKSMLELALCEKDVYPDRFKIHYASAKRAVDDLKNLKERIGTEGEHTLEDGMISCSALQLGFFALTLKSKDERKPYIEVAEYLMNIHKCLEELETPDCRMRGGTLRFWEAQYDVMIRGNMMNTPHGWTSWKTYATYYLYLLTGKEEYLKDTFDTMGACLQMIDENENLRWAFVKDPWRRVKVLVPDLEKPEKDGYESVPDNIEKAYRGKHVVKTIGEEYVDMVSGWYRVGEEKITGGYQLCPLYMGESETMVDNQGGACDNNVHEHFKCLEETLLKKVFIIVNDDGVKGYNCSVATEGDTIKVTPYGECEYIHINTDKKAKIVICGRKFEILKGENKMFRVSPLL